MSEIVIRNRIRALRIAHGDTQEQLAAACGVKIEAVLRELLPALPRDA